MTDMAKASILNRWQEIAEFDTGDEVQRNARQIYEFFKEAFENGFSLNGEWKTAVGSFHADDEIVKILHGIKANGGYDSDELYLCYCIDLHHCYLNGTVIRDLDWHLMNHCYTREPDGICEPATWRECYEWILDQKKDKQKKSKKERRQKK